MTDRASRALEAVERDPAARARFAAAYGRPGDPVAVLRREVRPDATADAARDAEVERLRRVAFDRTNTAEEEAAAELARRDLAALEEETRASRAALDRAIDAALEPARALAQQDRKSTRLNSSHLSQSRMPSSA